jgi:formylmethanofuran dehydrogenase subunit E
VGLGTMTEKDTFGEKLHDKEKADEDLYFAERDRELIAKQKARIAEETAARQSESAHMRCPKCGEHLSAETLHGLHVEVCATCQGVWLHHRPELEQLVRREEGGWLTRCLERIRGR